MKHGRPQLTTADQQDIRRYHEHATGHAVGWRREHAHRVWAAIVAVASVAIAWQEGYDANYYR
jgi:hypothetical protein